MVLIVQSRGGITRAYCVNCWGEKYGPLFNKHNGAQCSGTFRGVISRDNLRARDAPGLECVVEAKGGRNFDGGGDVGPVGLGFGLGRGHGAGKFWGGARLTTELGLPWIWLNMHDPANVRGQE